MFIRNIVANYKWLYYQIFGISAVAFLAACSSSLPIPREWAAVPAAMPSPAGLRASPIRVERTAEGERLTNDGKPLTPFFRAIDSFDLSTARKEVIFSAKRENNFDIGLVSADGSDVHWAQPDAADEIAVQWAPRGNKVSYTIRTRSGDFVRTLHIPTSAQLTNDFPNGRVRALAWDMPAEHYSVTWDSIDASSRVESMRYGGEERHVVTPPAVQLDAEVEVIADVRVLRPNGVRYNEKVPLVVWITSDPNSWDAERGALEQKVRVACAVTTAAPGGAFWTAIRATPWIDASRTYIVGAQHAGATQIVADDSIPSGHYRIAHNVVRARGADVKSVARGFIADQLTHDRR